jgi:hypothetical protein
LETSWWQVRTLKLLSYSSLLSLLGNLLIGSCANEADFMVFRQTMRNLNSIVVRAQHAKFSLRSSMTRFLVPALVTAPSSEEEEAKKQLESSVCVLESPCGVARGQILR